MHWKIVYGSYVPSYLLINLRQTTADVKDIKDIDIRDQRSFFHEYIHFLQDVTGGFGHSHIWYMYDRMRLIISDLQHKTGEEISIPVKNEVTEHQELLEGIMRSMEGSYHVPKNINDETAISQDANLYMDENFRKLYPGKQLHFLNLRLMDDRGQRGDYHFGESAVSETMAYLMEEKLFGAQRVLNFPYRACQKVGGYLNTHFTDNKEWLFALCDLAMCCPYPGMAFYTMLLDFHHSGFAPKHTEEIYEDGERTLKQRGWNIWKEFETNKNSAIYVVKQLFNHPIFTDTLNWFTYLLQAGFEYRKKNPYFMLQLYREESPFHGSWKDMYVNFGTPQLHNQDHKRYFCAPSIMKDKEKNIEPLYLLSLKQVHDTLYDGKSKCDLYECCKNAELGPETDYRCVTEPWLRVKDEKACAFAAQWALYGLANKKVSY